MIDERTKIKIHAELNESVIRATLRPQDLIPAFLHVIKETPEYVQIIQSNIPELSIIFDPTPFNDNDERWGDEYIHYFLNETLFDVLNLYAPEGYYFGAIEGDGSDFGYWKNQQQ